MSCAICCNCVRAFRRLWSSSTAPAGFSSSLKALSCWKLCRASAQSFRKPTAAPRWQHMCPVLERFAQFSFPVIWWAEPLLSIFTRHNIYLYFLGFWLCLFGLLLSRTGTEALYRLWLLTRRWLISFTLTLAMKKMSRWRGSEAWLLISSLFAHVWVHISTVLFVFLRQTLWQPSIINVLLGSFISRQWSVASLG